jgi:hypothetical protein
MWRNIPFDIHSLTVQSIADPARKIKHPRLPPPAVNFPRRHHRAPLMMREIMDSLT